MEFDEDLGGVEVELESEREMETALKWYSSSLQSPAPIDRLRLTVERISYILHMLGRHKVSSNSSPSTIFLDFVLSTPHDSQSSRFPLLGKPDNPITAGTFRYTRINMMN